MPIKTTHSDKAPAAIGPYSQAVIANGLLFSAGQIPLDPASGQIVEGDIVAQTEQVFRNLAAVIDAAGVTWTDVDKSGFTKLFGNPKPMDVEQWDITNASGGWFHPVHIHLIDGQIVGRNTNSGKPFAWEGGPKDVFYAGENETVSVLMQFDTTAAAGGRYMVHCHNLVHEDHDMMTQFAVGDLRTNDPMTSDPAVPETMPALPPVYRAGYPAGT